MVRSAFGHAVTRNTHTTQCCQLLQRGFPIKSGTHGRCCGDEAIKEVMNQLGGNGQPLIDVDRAEQSLNSVGHDAGLVSTTGGFFALAQANEFTQTETATNVG